MNAIRSDVLLALGDHAEAFDVEIMASGGRAISISVKPKLLPEEREAIEARNKEIADNIYRLQQVWSRRASALSDFAALDRKTL